MKKGMESRIRNIWTWVGVIGVVFASVDISMESLTSWPILFSALAGILSSPLQLTLVLGALVGVMVNPTTPGLADGDSTALEFTEPAEEEFVDTAQQEIVF